MRANTVATQVVQQAFWMMKDGPNRWAASLRWLCFSDTTLLPAATEANRVLRQLSLGGQAAMQAGLDFAFEVVSLCYNDAVPILIYFMMSFECAAQACLPCPDLLLH